MDGREGGRCGAVAMLTHVKNPISAARVVLENSNYILLVGDTAQELARVHGCEMVESNSYFDTPHRRRQFEKHLVAIAHGATFSGPEGSESGEALIPCVRPKRAAPGQRPCGTEVHIIPTIPQMMPKMPNAAAMGTIGVVCWVEGIGVAAATSTGGRTGKLPGRLGDTPIIGAGNYANNETLAVSGTGRGEQFMRTVLGMNLSAHMKYTGASVSETVDYAITEVLPHDSGGVIAVAAATGEVALSCNTMGMYRGFRTPEGKLGVGVWNDEIVEVRS